MPKHEKKIHKPLEPKNQTFFTGNILFFLTLYVIAFISLFSYSIYWILTAEHTTGVIDTYIHTVSWWKHGRYRPVTQTVVWFHDENNVYRRFTSNFDAHLPEWTPIEVIYKTDSHWGFTASFPDTERLGFVMKICFSLVPLLFFLLAYNVYRQQVAPKSESILRPGIIFFFAMEFIIFVFGYLAVSGEMGVFSSVIATFVTLFLLARFMGIVEIFQIPR